MGKIYRILEILFRFFCGQISRPLKIVDFNSPGILEPGAAQSWETGGSAQEGAVLSQGGGWMGVPGNPNQYCHF